MSEPLPAPPRLAPIPEDTETCGCCAGDERTTPLEVSNRPGLGAIAYRIGGYAQFRSSLHAGLSSSEFGALSDLRTRDDDDFTIGLLDAVACAADVLTFYQERLANESYLRTAQERLSLEEMGRLIGYRLRPGVAAETWLAFTLETPPSPPAGAAPEPGMFVSGVPAELTLSAGLGVRSVPGPGEQPQAFETVEDVLARPAWNAMQPWSSEIRQPGPGATSVFAAGVGTNLRAGDALLFVTAEYLAGRNPDAWDFRIIDRVVADAAHARTLVGWTRPLGPRLGTDASVAPQVFALRQRAAVYGHNAPAWGSMLPDFRTNYEAAFPRAESGAPVLLRVAASVREDWPRFVISPEADAVDLDTVYPSIPSDSFAVLVHGRASAAAEPGEAAELYAVTSVSEVSREEFALAGKVTRLVLDGPRLNAFAAAVRDVTVFAQSEALPLAEHPVDDAVSGAFIPVSAPADGLERGRRVLVRGTRLRDGVAIVHAATLVAARGVGGAKEPRCTLEIAPPLPAPLARASVAVHANVALATHGESVTQILGAGNGAMPFQRFELKQMPLTFRAAPTELGAASELTVRVDDVRWQERDTLFGATPQDRAFVLLSDEQGRRFVQFGDGVRGARLPSGVNNVRATYRKGLGAAGNVREDTLTQLTTRPSGLKGVSNPRAAEGGTDPETADLARRAMPLMTRTLGRAVSVLDYEDFARAYAGVAKARAAVLHLHTGPVVVVTIAAAGGAAIPPESPIAINLHAALVASGDPHVRVRLLTYRASTFRIGLKVKRDPDYEAKQVLGAVEAALRAHFAFDARELGQPVQQSEVVAVVHGVAGVRAVDLDLLYGGTEPASQTVVSRQTRLLAGRMTVRAGAPIADELLTLDPAPLDRLEEMR